MIQTERVDWYRNNPGGRLTTTCAFRLWGCRTADESVLVLPPKTQQVKGRGAALKTPHAWRPQSGSREGCANSKWHFTRSSGDTKLQEGHSFGKSLIYKLKSEPRSSTSAVLALDLEALDFQFKGKCVCHLHLYLPFHQIFLLHYLHNYLAWY